VLVVRWPNIGSSATEKEMVCEKLSQLRTAGSVIGLSKAENSMNLVAVSIRLSAKPTARLWTFLTRTPTATIILLEPDVDISLSHPR
jgi:hypothetical protein